MFQQSSNIQLLQFHFYEMVLEWRNHSDFQKYRIRVDEQHVSTYCEQDMMIFPIGREVWSSNVPEIEWLKISTLLKLALIHFLQIRNGIKKFQ